MFEYIVRNRFLFIALFVAIVAPTFFFGAIRFVLGVITAIVLILIIASWIFNIRFMSSVNRMNSEMNNRANKESDPNIKFGKTESRSRRDMGEYVDFEEIKEEKK